MIHRTSPCALDYCTYMYFHTQELMFCSMVVGASYCNHIMGVGVNSEHYWSELFNFFLVWYYYECNPFGVNCSTCC